MRAENSAQFLERLGVHLQIPVRLRYRRIDFVALWRRVWATHVFTGYRGTLPVAQLSDVFVPEGWVLPDEPLHELRALSAIDHLDVNPA